MRHYSCLHLMFDFTMTVLTGGLWLIWVMVRYFSSRSR